MYRAPFLAIAASVTFAACDAGDTTAPALTNAEDTPAASASRGPTGQACVGCPVVTSHILYSRINLSGNRDIYIMNTDGTGRSAVSATIADETEPAWSPNYSRVVFNKTRKGSGGPLLNGLWTIAWNGTGPVRVTTDSADRGASWGKTNRIVFHSRRDNPLGTANEIYTINPDGTGLVRLTNNGADDRDPAWSPDGTKIVFASNRSYRGLGRMHLWVMNADGTGLQQLTTGLDSESQPAWSPDGTRIAYHYSNGIAAVFTNGTKDNSIYMPSSDNSHTWYLGEPTWSPDGKSLAFTSTYEGVYKVITWTPGFAHTLTPLGDQDQFPAWAN